MTTGTTATASTLAAAAAALELREPTSGHREATCLPVRCKANNVSPAHSPPLILTARLFDHGSTTGNFGAINDPASAQPDGPEGVFASHGGQLGTDTGAQYGTSPPRPTRHVHTLILTHSDHPDRRRLQRPPHQRQRTHPRSRRTVQGRRLRVQRAQLHRRPGARHSRRRRRRGKLYYCRDWRQVHGCALTSTRTRSHMRAY